MKPGNSCLYFLQQTCNILILISGLLIIGLGIYLWVDTKVFSFIEIVFFALGGAEIIVSLLALSSRRSSLRITVYIVLLLIIFLVQLTGTILGFYFKSDLVDKAVDFQEESAQSAQELEKLINDHVTIAMYLSLICLGIQALALMFTACYKDSLQSHNENYHLMYSNQAGRLVTLDEAQGLQAQTAKAKSDQKRQELYSQNPQFYEWKQKQEQDEQSLQKIKQGKK